MGIAFLSLENMKTLRINLEYSDNILEVSQDKYSGHLGYMEGENSSYLLILIFWFGHFRVSGEEEQEEDITRRSRERTIGTEYLVMLTNKWQIFMSLVLLLRHYWDLTFSSTHSTLRDDGRLCFFICKGNQSPDLLAQIQTMSSSRTKTTPWQLTILPPEGARSRI